ncbi:MAG: ansB [Pelosinus sp.]|jgi:L-asparaginase|nr:ansB [Pelosinus sp.]
MLNKKIVSITLVCLVLLLVQFNSVLAAELPNVHILATGGTIAGRGGTSTQTTGYAAGVIGVETLIEAVPEMKQYANISGEQFCNIASNQINYEIWLKLAKRVNELLESPQVDGIVITHGTDTLEETAYFLNLVVKSDKPVVLVGSMRPATAISADGPGNLLNAVQLAGSLKARSKGVLVAMNDQIMNARDATKTNTTHVETFKAPELGYLGYMQNGVPYFYRETTRKHGRMTEFDVKDMQDLPYVGIIYGHVGNEISIRAVVDALVASGAKGIVYAGTGHGSIKPASLEALSEAQKKGVVVVRTSRVGNGIVTQWGKYAKANIIAGDTLNAQKAAILLSVALTKTNNLATIQQMFDEY